MHFAVKILIVVIAIFIALAAGMAAIRVCPPPGPWPTPPWCGTKGYGVCTGTTCGDGTGTNTFVLPALPARVSVDTINVTVTVPYWTTGEIYLGTGDNATYLKLEKINDVTYQGTGILAPETNYYYSRGSVTTKERPRDRRFTTSPVFDAVVDWQDSPKTIIKTDFQKSFYLGACHFCDVSITKGNFIEPMKQAMDDVKASGANWVNLVPMWFIVPDYRGNEVKPIYAAEFKGNTGWVTATITDADLITLINEAHARGLKVYLVPHLAPENWGPGVKGKGDIQPTDPDSFFANYTAFIDHYADIARQTGVELYGIGNELDTLTETDIQTSPLFNKSAKWRDVIHSVRQHYHGPLTYSVSCIDEQRCGPQLIPFWDELDVIGWEWYVPIASGPHESIPSMKQNAERIIANNMKPLADRYNKPVVITEIGWEAYPGACAHTYGNGPAKGADRIEQAACYEATFQAIENKDFIKGMHIWTWTANRPGRSFSWVFTDTANEVRFSIAEDEIAKWYEKIQI